MINDQVLAEEVALAGTTSTVSAFVTCISQQWLKDWSDLSCYSDFTCLSEVPEQSLSQS